MMRESDLRRLVTRSMPQVHWQAIETGGTGLGVPDLNGCAGGVEFWVELKVVRVGLLARITPTQVAWHLRRHRAGGRTFFLVAWRGELRLYLGRIADALHREGMRLEPHRHWSQQSMDWDDLLSEVRR